MEFEKDKIRRSEVRRPPRSSLRLRFEAEVEVLLMRYGSLEAMRKRLQLSRREICKILLVDPSAWTRWTSHDRTAPPHVYKTMALLMEKVEKNPEAFNAQNTQNADLNTLKKIEADLKKVEVEMRQEQRVLNEQAQKELLSQIEIVRSEAAKLKMQAEQRLVLTLGWKFLIILNAVLLLYVLIR